MCIRDRDTGFALLLAHGHQVGDVEHGKRHDKTAHGEQAEIALMQRVPKALPLHKGESSQ